MPPVIDVQHVGFGYDDKQVLDDITFQVVAGEFVAVIGPNGGGKTTLLKLLMGFLKPNAGTIHLFGHVPGTNSEQVGYVPQVLRFDRQFPISVLEVVLSGRLSHLPWYGRFHRKDREAALEALELVGLADYRDHAFGQLSGGQAQRILIARALVCHPQLLLLDEPTASVDAKAEETIYQLLHSLKKEMTIVMVTHDLRVVIEHVERVLCVQTQLSSLAPQEVCAHFALGLYHPPMINIERSSR